MSDPQILIFDTGPLVHFAREGWLGPLRAVVGGRRALIPEVVADELRVFAAGESRVLPVLESPWLGTRQLTSSAELEAFATFSEVLVHKGRNIGEAGVLALARCTGGTAVIDDMAARTIGKRHGVAVSGTLALLCEAIRAGLLTVPLVSALADELLQGDYRYPFEYGGFQKWASENGLI